MVESGTGTSTECGATENSDTQSADGASSEGDDPSSTPDNPPGTGCHIELRLLAGDTDPPSKSYLSAHFKRVVELEGITQCRLTVAVVDAGHMTRLHRQHLDRPGPTDVLTFDLRCNQAQPGSAGALEGDIVICKDVAEQRAAQHGHDARAELLLYAVHGPLHLTGHDDHDPARAAAMHAREDELLTVVGVGPIYAIGETRE